MRLSLIFMALITLSAYYTTEFKKNTMINAFKKDAYACSRMRYYFDIYL
jgi:hypothetical protein